MSVRAARPLSAKRAHARRTTPSPLPRPAHRNPPEGRIEEWHAPGVRATRRHPFSSGKSSSRNSPDRPSVPASSSSRWRSSTRRILPEIVLGSS